MQLVGYIFITGCVLTLALIIMLCVLIYDAIATLRAKRAYYTQERKTIEWRQSIGREMERMAQLYESDYIGIQEHADVITIYRRKKREYKEGGHN